MAKRAVSLQAINLIDVWARRLSDLANDIVRRSRDRNASHLFLVGHRHGACESQRVRQRFSINIDSARVNVNQVFVALDSDHVLIRAIIFAFKDLLLYLLVFYFFLRKVHVFTILQMIVIALSFIRVLLILLLKHSFEILMVHLDVL